MKVSCCPGPGRAPARTPRPPPRPPPPRPRRRCRGTPPLPTPSSAPPWSTAAVCRGSLERGKIFYESKRNIFTQMFLISSHRHGQTSAPRPRVEVCCVYWVNTSRHKQKCFKLCLASQTGSAWGEYLLLKSTQPLPLLHSFLHCIVN